MPSSEFDVCSRCTQYYAGGPLNATCIQVVERDACNNPGLQNVSQSEITGGAVDSMVLDVYPALTCCSGRCAILRRGHWRWQSLLIFLN